MVNPSSTAATICALEHRQAKIGYFIGFTDSQRARSGQFTHQRLDSGTEHFKASRLYCGHPRSPENLTTRDITNPPPQNLILPTYSNTTHPDTVTTPFHPTKTPNHAHSPPPNRNPRPKPLIFTSFTSLQLDEFFAKIRHSRIKKTSRPGARTYPTKKTYNTYIHQAWD